MSSPQFSKTKIVATVGPACDGPTQLEELIVAGVDVFRLDMAHADRQRQSMRLAAIRQASRQLGQPVAVLADLTLEDQENALWARASQVDFVGLSVVGPDDVIQLQELLAGRESSAQVIARIEKPETLEHLVAIVAAADGVMIADGDLAAQPDIAAAAVAQQRIISECNHRGKPVIVATQAADAANAVLGRADACMLAEETARGAHPREAVALLHRIALATEPLVRPDRPAPGSEPEPAAVRAITAATVQAATHLAEALAAKLMVVASASGATALALSKTRSSVPTLGVSQSEATLRRMCLYWGVIPLAGAPSFEPRPLVEFVGDWGRRNRMLAVGDRVVLVVGTGLADSVHHQIVVHEVATV